MSNTTDVVVVAPEVGTAKSNPYLDWSAIFGGAVLATAVTAILTAFASAIGLSMVSADTSESSSAWVLSLAAGLFAVWMAICANFAGGYLAGRMRRPARDASAHERDVRDGANGIVVWALGSLLVLGLVSSGIGNLARTAGAAASSVASGAASLVQMQGNPLETAVDSVMRTTGQTAPTQEERQETTRIFTNAVASDQLPAADRDYIASRIAARSNIPQPEAHQRVDQAYSQLQQAKATADEAAERARRAGVITAFMSAAVLLLGAAVAWFAAQRGGSHRDDEIDSGLFGRRR